MTLGCQLSQYPKQPKKGEYISQFIFRSTFQSKILMCYYINYSPWVIRNVRSILRLNLFQWCFHEIDYDIKRTFNKIQCWSQRNKEDISHNFYKLIFIVKTY